MREPTLLQRFFNNPLAMTILFGMGWTVGIASGDHRHFSGNELITRFAIGLGVGAVLALQTQRRLQKIDDTLGIQSFEQRVTLGYALKTGELPSDAPTKQLLPTYLDYVESRYAKQQRGNRIVFPIIIIAYVLNAILSHSLWWIVVGGLFMCLVAYSLRQQARMQPNIPKLRAALAKK